MINSLFESVNMEGNGEKGRRSIHFSLFGYMEERKALFSSFKKIPLPMLEMCGMRM